MATKLETHHGPLFLGIEGGGTRTVALLADAHGRQVQRAEAGPGNLKLLTDAQLLRLFRFFAAQFLKPSALGIGMAGARTASDLTRIRRVAARVWPRTACYATGDLETALAAAEMANGGDRIRMGHRTRDANSAATTILVLSGTGSCCYGKNIRGKTAKVGGWGHLLGDRGSAYEIGLCALRSVLHGYDQTHEWPKLGQFILRSLLLNEPEALVEWAQQASKTDVATLAVEVFAAWRSRDRLAAKIIAEAADELVAGAMACAQRLAKQGQPVKFVLAGGTLLKQTAFAKLVHRRLKNLSQGASIVRLQRESVWGAVELAARIAAQSKVQHATTRIDRASTAEDRTGEIEDTAFSPTEQRNPRSRNLDHLSTARAVELMISEDAGILRALRVERRRIAQGVKLISTSLRRGGRLFYVGAGTSGRLGVLDASECPPTFRTLPAMVQGIIAGGQTALWRAVEGAEDDAAAGARAIQFRGISALDVVVGITASGRTLFVWGALSEARCRHAKTILLTFNPHAGIPTKSRPTLVIAPNVGPEILTGSTRLKAGTATKLVLNMFTTLAMVSLGKVAGNLMVDLNPSNKKLRHRAVRIVRTLTRVNDAVARDALEKTGWVVKDAVARLSHARAYPSA